MDALLWRFYGCDPNRLTMLQYQELLERIADCTEIESGHRDHRSYVERMARRNRKGK